MKLFSTTSQNPLRSFLLLAPRGADIPETFASVAQDSGDFEKMLAAIQRFRAEQYLSEGAIQQDQVTPDGRFEMPQDSRSWHLITLTRNRTISACMRYLLHPNSISFNSLRVRHTAIARIPEWSARVRRAVQEQIELARKEDVGFLEIGGWAIDDSFRGTTEAIRMLLATWAWGRVVGGCRGLSTATARNGSASILRRIGGHRLVSDGEELPEYFDAAYGCGMELLSFDSRFCNPRYSGMLDDVLTRFADIPVIQADAAPVHHRRHVLKDIHETARKAGSMAMLHSPAV